MCDQTEVQYLPGEVVWVKLRALWWPGQVQDYDALPEEITGSLRKRPLAVVKFFQEDTFEYVHKLDLIYHYNCSRKHEFIKKGLDLARKKTSDRPSNMDLFPSDVVRAEHLTNGDPDVINDDAFKPEAKPKYESLFGGEKKKLGRKKGKDDSPVKLLTPWRGKSMGWRSRGKSPSVVKPDLDTPRTITHRRFIQKALDGTSDYQSHIREQKRSASPVPQKEYSCVSCGFVTCRLNVIVLHFNSTHSPKVKEEPVIRPKAKARSVRTPINKVKEEGKSSVTPEPTKKVTICDETPMNIGEEEEKKTSRVAKRKVRLVTDNTEIKKPKVVATLLADWEEDAEQEQQEQEQQEEKERDRQKKEEEDKTVPELETVSTSKSKEVFEFDEDDGIDFDLSKNVKGFGRRIPRVIDSTKRPKRTKQDSNDFDEINDEVNTLLAETLVPSLPSVPLTDKEQEEEEPKNLLPEVGLAVDLNIPPQGNESTNTAIEEGPKNEMHEVEESEQPIVPVKNNDDVSCEKIRPENGEFLEEETDAFHEQGNKIVGKVAEALSIKEAGEKLNDTEENLNDAEEELNDAEGKLRDGVQPLCEEKLRDEVQSLREEKLRDGVQPLRGRRRGRPRGTGRKHFHKVGKKKIEDKEAMILKEKERPMDESNEVDVEVDFEEPNISVSVEGNELEKMEEFKFLGGGGEKVVVQYEKYEEVNVGRLEEGVAEVEIMQDKKEDEEADKKQEAMSPKGTGQSTSGGDHNYVIGGAGSRKRKRPLLPMDRHESEVDVDALPEELDGSFSFEDCSPVGSQPVSSSRRPRTKTVKSPKKVNSKTLSPISGPKSPLGSRSPRSPSGASYPRSPPAPLGQKSPKSPPIVSSPKSPKSPKSPRAVIGPKSPKSPPAVVIPKSPKSPLFTGPKGPKSPPALVGFKTSASLSPVSAPITTPSAPSPKSTNKNNSTSLASKSPRSTQPMPVAKASRCSPAKIIKSPVIRTVPAAKKPLGASDKDCPIIIKNPKNSATYIVQSSKASPTTTQSQSSLAFKGGQTLKTIKVSLPSGTGSTTTSPAGRKIMIVQNKAGTQSSSAQKLISGGKQIIFLKGSGSNLILSPQQQKILASSGKVTTVSQSKPSTSIPNIVATPISSSELQGGKQLKIIKSTSKGQAASNVLLNTASGQILVPVSSVSGLNPPSSSSPSGTKSYLLPVGGTGSGGKMILQSKVVLPAMSKASPNPQPIKLISGPAQQLKMASMVVPAQSPKSVGSKAIPKTIASPSGVAVMMPHGRTQIKPKVLQSAAKSPLKNKSGIVPNPHLKNAVPKVETSIASPAVKKLSGPPVTLSPVSEVTAVHTSPSVVTSGVEQLLAGTGGQQLVAVPTEDGGQVMYLIGNNSLLGLDNSGQAVDGSGTTLFLDPTPQSSLGNLILTFDNVSVSSATGATSSGQDILAEALANTQVLQSEVPVPGSDIGLLAPSSNSSLFSSSVPTLSHGVLETSLTLNQPIMTPLEDLSAVSALQPPPSVSSAIDLPITITQPDITISTSSYASLPIPSATIQSTVFSDSQHVSNFTTSVPLLTTDADANAVLLDGETFINTESSSSASMPLLDAPE